jgi:hypothetical protein
LQREDVAGAIRKRESDFAEVEEMTRPAAAEFALV